MPVLFVHEVPDTLRVWDAVVSRLDRKDVVRLSLPGFGCSLPKNFNATKEAYVEWLLGQLVALAGPIDLVGRGAKMGCGRRASRPGVRVAPGGAGLADAWNG